MNIRSYFTAHCFQWIDGRLSGLYGGITGWYPIRPPILIPHPSPFTSSFALAPVTPPPFTLVPSPPTRELADYGVGDHVR